MTRHVVVLGGGFGGIAAARGLAGSDVKVTLVDRRNHHLFQPLLYQVATAGLAPSDIAEPIRSMLSAQRDVSVRLASATEVDAAGKRVCLETVIDGQRHREWVSYDYLVMALGVQQSWFGRDDWAAVAPGLKTIRDALEIRRRILMAFERAEWTTDPEERAALLTFVVVGGGPTGVELAGAIAEIAMTTLRSDFRNIDTRDARVVLVEAGQYVLAPYHADLRDIARAQLESLGVEVRTGAPVTEVDAAGVVVGGDRIGARTVLWAAGIAAPAITATLGVPLDKAGRVIVGSDTSVSGHPEVFVVGDIAHFEQDLKPLPGVAPAAQGMGAHAAAMICADLTQNARWPYRFVDKGQMATIGRRRAVLQAGPIRLSGFIAWLAWVFVHLMVLVTFRNRALVFIKWAWAWFFYERGSRLVWKTEEPAGGEFSDP